MAASLSGLFTGRFVRGLVDPRLGKLKKKSTLSGTQTDDLPSCTILPQPTTLPRAPRDITYYYLLFFLLELWEVESILGPRGTAAITCPIVPVPGDCEDGEVGGMKCG
jgi:hypothetical protein